MNVSAVIAVLLTFLTGCSAVGGRVERPVPLVVLDTTCGWHGAAASDAIDVDRPVDWSAFVCYDAPVPYTLADIDTSLFSWRIARDVEQRYRDVGIDLTVVAGEVADAPAEALLVVVTDGYQEHHTNHLGWALIGGPHGLVYASRLAIYGGMLYPGLHDDDAVMTWSTIIGNIVAHEVGHLLGWCHKDCGPPCELMGVKVADLNKRWEIYCGQ